jgi:electron transfer flavoprotein alpha subunit
MSAASKDVWIYVEHLRGKVAGQTPELLGKGREIAAGLNGRAIAVQLGGKAQPPAESLGAADGVLRVEDAALEEFVPETYAAVLGGLLAERAPRLLLVGATSMGMDLAALLSAQRQLPMVANCQALALEDGRLIATSRMCGGKLLCEVEIEDAAILTVLAGAFPAPAAAVEGRPVVETVTPPAALEGIRTRMVRIIEPEPGDVDITKAEVLVGIGRGIQRKENLPLAEELAGLLGGTLCASRPVVDQGWLPMARQVGLSGMVVRPKVYFALGISGASEHVEGMKDSDLIIAVNSDPKAPIFDVADYGAAVDLFEVLPVLVEALKAARAAAG